MKIRQDFLDDLERDLQVTGPFPEPYTPLTSDDLLDLCISVVGGARYLVDNEKKKFNFTLKYVLASLISEVRAYSDSDPFDDIIRLSHENLDESHHSADRWLWILSLCMSRLYSDLEDEKVGIDTYLRDVNLAIEYLVRILQLNMTDAEFLLETRI